MRRSIINRYNNIDSIAEKVRFMRDSTSRYIERMDMLFTANKEKIMSHSPGMTEEIAKEAFRDNISSAMFQKNLSFAEASKRVLNSALYKDKREVMVENALKGIKSDRDAYDVWRRLTQHRKIDRDSITYEGNNIYKYTMRNKTIYINFHNSPQYVSIYAR